MNTKEEIELHEKHCQASCRTWGPGPWQSEPNRVEFEHAGLQCLLSRNPQMGNWCGYVGLPKEHPLHNKHYRDLTDEPEVHGGITYSEHCGGNICHVTDSEDNLFWLGFDCAHFGDLLPSMGVMETPRFTAGYESYKDVAFVRAETENLAEQLAKVK